MNVQETQDHGRYQIACERARAALTSALSDSDPVDLSWIHPPPSNDGWTLSADALVFLARITRALQPRHILEFGSGASTRLLARVGADLQQPSRISSVDHDPEFAVAGRFEGPCPIDLQIAPLVARDFGGKLLPAYHLDRSKIGIEKADLVIVDGPPVNLGGREGILYQSMEFVRPGSILLLDDADRGNERLAVRHWQDVLRWRIEAISLPGFVKGMTAVIFREPVAVAQLWDIRCESATIELTEHVSGYATVAVIGHDLIDPVAASPLKIRPFVERDGESWGAPIDSNAAIEELSRLKKENIEYVALLWPHFWWLDYYREFIDYMERNSRTIVRSDCLLLFQLC